MEELPIKYIANSLNLPYQSVKNTLELLITGATVPFIARYRKEATQNLDEVDILNISTVFEEQQKVEKRKEFIIKTLEEQGDLTPQLKNEILRSNTLLDLEDLYAPFKKKRKTKATIAIENGLEPLAKSVFAQNKNNIKEEARLYLNKNAKNIEEALEGARHIISEWISDNIEIKNKLRNLYKREAIITSSVKKGKKEAGEKFQDYFDFSQELKNIPSHRFLAINRGKNEGFLKVKISADSDKALSLLSRQFLQGLPEPKKQVELAIEDAFKRLISKSLETEFENLAKEKADKDAIDIFRKNLRQLLLHPPLGQKTILALDPGFKSGCKAVVLNELGNLIFKDIIFLFKEDQALTNLENWFKKHNFKAIAIGNGTASRETEALVKKWSGSIPVHVVSEQGASIYSASEIAREEFPDLDLTYRGAISIGRRLLDPLSELVKIDPKSIGVGQYQHDVNHNLLLKSLGSEVESVVNAVGVELNSASKHLLSYVSGLNASVAANIIEYRNTNGGFSTRQELKKVPKLGAKTFEQCAGFLRIFNGKNPLDNTAIHPESYDIVKKMSKGKVAEFIENKQLREGIKIEEYISEQAGTYTLKDILDDLNKPNRDPRGVLEEFSFSDVNSIDDLHEGMVLNGIVTNITAFGCFVDVGVHQDGLLHISQMANRFIKDPNEVVHVGKKLRIKIIELQIERKRISLSLLDI